MNRSTLASILSVILFSALAAGLSACAEDRGEAAAEPQATQPATETAVATPPPAALTEVQAEPAPTTETPAPAEPAAPLAGYSHPESVAPHAGKLYVSNLGAQLTPTEQDGDGYILVASGDGDTSHARRFEVEAPLHAPKGLMVWNNALYLTDVNKVYGFDLNDHSLLFAVEPGLQHPDEPQPRFLNDIVAENQRSFFVSATDTNTLYRIVNDFVPAIFKLDIDTALKGPNGLAYDANNNQLYIAGWGTDNQNNGELGVVDLNSPAPHKYTRLGEHSGHLDGLVKIGDQLIYSDWVDFAKSGHLYSYKLSSGETANSASKRLPAPLISASAPTAVSC